MIRLTAQLDSNLAKFAGKQLPYVASVALNRTAIGARDLVRDNLPKRFRLRNNWTRGGVQARTSSKTNLMARVLAPEYMLIQETGGIRQPTKSRLLASPTEEVIGNRVIPRAKRPRALIAAGKAFVLPFASGDGAGVFDRRGKKLRLLYALTPEQSYEERFHFEDDVRSHVESRFSTNFAAALADAMK